MVDPGKGRWSSGKEPTLSNGSGTPPPFIDCAIITRAADGKEGGELEEREEKEEEKEKKKEGGKEEKVREERSNERVGWDG